MFRIVLDAPDDFDGFRDAARSLRAADVPPDAIQWSVAGAETLFGDPKLPRPTRESAFAVPRAFLSLAETVVCHADPQRFALLYRLLWRITNGERRLLDDAADRLVHRLGRMRKGVARDMHKMTAFVRFREVLADDGAHFVAWFEPEHFILRRVAPFFSGRFAGMRWSILTPQGSLYWDGETLRDGPALSRQDAPDGDALESWWKTYYRSTFNPARANAEAMRAEMPKKYWRNLPEAPLIPGMLAQAAERTDSMIAKPHALPRKGKAMPQPAPAAPAIVGSLADLAAQAKVCERCPLFGHATQTVFGEGPRDAAAVFVGEQPGDHEDLQGKPFVGPAGQMFDRALAEAGVDRAQVYVTNAVKHFKFEPRGKRRIHKKPNNAEVDACRWWLDRELALLAPPLTVALGATAARALTGRDVTISRERGRLIELRPGLAGFITVHPSYLLRLPDAVAKAAEYDRFVADLRSVAAHLASHRQVA